MLPSQTYPCPCWSWSRPRTPVPHQRGSTTEGVDTSHVPARRVSPLLLKAVVVLASANHAFGLLALINGNTVLSATTGALALVLLVVVLVVVRRSRPPRR